MRPRRAASADSDFSGLPTIRKPDLGELIVRRKRPNRRGARKVRAGCAESPNAAFVEFSFFRRAGRQLRKTQRRAKSLKKKKTPPLSGAV